MLRPSKKSRYIHNVRAAMFGEERLVGDAEVRHRCKPFRTARKLQHLGRADTSRAQGIHSVLNSSGVDRSRSA